MGDTAQTFEEFHLAWMDHVVCEALSRSGDEEVAQEVAQRLFAELWVTGRWDGIQSPKRYLAEAVRRMVQRHQGRRRLSSAVHECTDVADPSLDPLQSVARVERRAAVQQAIATLPPRCRAVMELVVQRDWPSSRIAIELGVSRKAVEKQRAHGQSRLRQWFGERGGSDPWLPD